MDNLKAGSWSFIRKRSLRDPAAQWATTELCANEAESHARVAELQASDPTFEYRADAFLELPIWISRKPLSPHDH